MSSAKRLAAVLGAAFAASTAVAASGATAWTAVGEASGIVFARGDDLYVTSTDGEDVRRLARRAGQPTVSPDARHIAFVRNRAVWVMERDGSGQRRVTSGHDDLTPEWSADGKFIYFSRLVEGEDAYGGYEFARPIFRVEIDGGGLRQLTRPTPSDHGTCHDSPAAAPDGRIVAFAVFAECDRGYGVAISAIDPEGKPRSLGRFDLAQAGFDPAWSPDGRSFAYTTLNEGEQSTGIAVAEARRRAVRIYRRAAADPAWSPDGRWVALVRTSGSRGTIWLVRSDGTGLRRLSSRRYDSDPAWLPALR